MAYQIHIGGVCIGSVIRSEGGNAFAYDPLGSVVGQFGDCDAAILALSRLQRAAA
ncbi:hypothetical protein MKK70_15620 [Methylobacterium sp. E-041]|uniref:hypothetical protein n=1 Tax=Methylobacterium sp. E-041 TaxID=2836573 RepID=UPI001FB8935B|nr:hypothetical protein [Methylobacterium sp. E-041]MCJ2106776.1 hypothetical protein [Methylobacterium sp. E-041]